MRLPDEPTTPQQWQVIAWSAILLAIVLGAIGFWCSYMAPAQKTDLAGQVRWCSFAAWGVAGALYLVKILVERFLAE